MPLALSSGMLWPELSPAAQTLLRAGYGLLLLAFLLMTLPHGRRFFLSERWGGYAQASPGVDALQNPVVYPLLMASWLLAAGLLVVGCGTSSCVATSSCACAGAASPAAWALPGS